MSNYIIVDEKGSGSIVFDKTTGKYEVIDLGYTYFYKDSLTQAKEALRLIENLKIKHPDLYKTKYKSRKIVVNKYLVFDTTKEIISPSGTVEEVAGQALISVDMFRESNYQLTITEPTLINKVNMDDISIRDEWTIRNHILPCLRVDDIDSSIKHICNTNIDPIPLTIGILKLAGDENNYYQVGNEFYSVFVPFCEGKALPMTRWVKFSKDIPITHRYTMSNSANSKDTWLIYKKHVEPITQEEAIRTIFNSKQLCEIIAHKFNEISYQDGGTITFNKDMMIYPGVTVKAGYTHQLTFN